MDRDKLYQKLFAAFRTRFSGENGRVVQEKCNECWKNIKNETDLALIIESQVEKLRQESQKQSIASFFDQSRINLKKGKKKDETLTDTCVIDSSDSDSEIPISSHSPTSTISTSAFPTPSTSAMSTPSSSPVPFEKNAKQFSTPKQDQLQQEIDVINVDLNALYKKRSLCLIDNEGIKQIRDFEKKLVHLKRTLTHKKYQQTQAKVRRAKQREVLQKLSRNNPEMTKDVQLRAKCGRPSLDFDQPGIIQTIIEIVSSTAAAHEKRQMEILNTCKTIDALKTELEYLGYSLSRSALYLRLLPRRVNTNEAKKHVNPAPVKVLRARDDLHKGHQDSRFCKATLDHLKELASILGNNQVLLISQDDKAKVPIGIPAASKQQAFMMNVEYKVCLPDHTFPVAPGYKLVPSVYMALALSNEIGAKSAVAASGPTYIAIRSAKFSGSSAATHQTDFEKILTIKEFDRYTKMNDQDEMMKPVLISLVDGGPDQNPRYKGVMECAIETFIRHDLDAVFIATNAPGRSAFNPVEHRMAPLSRMLSGLILPAKHFQTEKKDDPDKQNETEMLNFEHAGMFFYIFWSSLLQRFVFF